MLCKEKQIIIEFKDKAQEIKIFLIILFFGIYLKTSSIK
ncbi:MAG: hypothetical protein BAJALOKI1v1_1460006 [Promethearchaeota archaeon]|nr:MAG: hypothetical protein BAJALOKI1v1_1460006 [Candidatus Lokiarchaeota archaeon]